MERDFGAGFAGLLVVAHFLEAAWFPTTVLSLARIALELRQPSRYLSALQDLAEMAASTPTKGLIAAANKQLAAMHQQMQVRGLSAVVWVPRLFSSLQQ